MKPGTTVIENRTNPTFPPLVSVGSDDRMVRVTFGTIDIMLSAQGDGSTIVVRGEAYDEMGHSVPLEMRGATDVRNTVEFTIREAPAVTD